MINRRTSSNRWAMGSETEIWREQDGGPARQEEVGGIGALASPLPAYLCVPHCLRGGIMAQSGHLTS